MQSYHRYVLEFYVRAYRFERKDVFEFWSVCEACLRMLWTNLIMTVPALVRIANSFNKG